MATAFRATMLALAGALLAAAPVVAEEEPAAPDSGGELLLNDPAASSEDLEEQSGTPPQQATSVDGSGYLQGPTGDTSLTGPPPIDSGSITSLDSLSSSATSISTLNATISNNDFQN